MKQSLFFNKNLRIVYLITLMAVLGVASITPALPKIARQYNLTGESIGLLIIVFTLPGVILTPVFGVLADRLGRKKIVIPSLILFGVAGTACAWNVDFNLLLIFRFLQGIGSASLGSLNVTIIGDLFKKDERASAMGYNASVLSVATASYPFIGGILASVDWHYVFVLPAFSIPIALVVAFGLKNPEPETMQNFKEYLSRAFNSIKSKNAVILLGISIITFILLYGSYLTYLPILLDKNFSAKPFLIGIVMSVMSAVTAVVSSQLGKLFKKINAGKILIASFVLYGISLLLIPFMSNIFMIIAVVVIYGLGHGLNIPSIQTLLSNIAPLEYRAAFMSMNGMVLRLGQTLGPLITGFFFVSGGLQLVFIGGAAIAFLTVIPLYMLDVENR